MQRELVDRGLRQIDAGAVASCARTTRRQSASDVSGYASAATQCVPHAGFTPATCTSAAMKRAHSSRCAASILRPLSVMR